MLYPVLPMYLQSLGFSIVLIGVFEGFAEALTGLSKGYFGKWSDNIGKRVPFVQAGYGLSGIARPLMVLFANPFWVFFMRSFDRLGKGIRTAARDALISDESTETNKAKVFGFHRSLDTLGAVLGPCIALIYLHYYPGDYKNLFLIAFIPGLLAILSSGLIKESKQTHLANNHEKIKLAALHNQPAPAPAPAYTPPKGISFDKNNPEHVASMAATTASELEKNKRDYPTTATTPEEPAATQAAANPFGQMTRTLNTYAPPETTSTGGTLKQTATGQVHRAGATNPNAQPQQAATPVKTANFAGPTVAPAAGGQMELDLSPANPSSRKLAGKTPAWADRTAAWDNNNLKTVSETIKQVKKMLETVQTRDDVNFIKKYINHEFDRRGMVNQLATVQRNHLIERVTQIAAGRRRDHARQLAH